MTALTKYDAARFAVEAARTVDEAKDISDKAAALQHYARQAHDPDLELWVAEIRVRAKRRIGELSAKLDTAQGTNLPNVPTVGHSGKRAVLKAAGLSKS
jgi:hypothetical protein